MTYRAGQPPSSPDDVIRWAQEELQRVGDAFALGDNTHALQATTVIGVKSIVGGGDLSADRTLEFVNDLADPGGNLFYGTNSAGIRGWWPQAAETKSGIWRWETQTTAPPSSGKIRANAATGPAVTLAWINNLDDANDDTSALLATIVAGNTLRFQDRNDADAYAVYTCTGPSVDQTTYFEVPVSFIEGGGVALTNNAEVIMTLSQQGAGGGGGGLPEAPNDGQDYWRNTSAWVVGNWTSLDGKPDLDALYVKKVGDTMTGTLSIVRADVANAEMILDSLASNISAFRHRVAGVLRAHTSWSSPNGYWEARVFDAAGAAGQQVIRGVHDGETRLNYAGTTRLQTSSAGGTLTGVWNALTNLQEAGVNLASKYAPIAHVGAGGTAHASFGGAGTRGFVPDPVTSSGGLNVLNDLGQWVPRGVTVSGPIILNYRFDNSVVATDPGTGDFQFNNALKTLTTAIYISETSANGNPLSAVLDTIRTGDLVQTVDQTGATASATFTVTGLPVDNGVWRTIPVAYYNGTGGELGNNNNCQIGLIANPNSRLPQGGTTDQILAKTSNTDYATAWQTPYWLPLTGGTLTGDVFMPGAGNAMVYGHTVFLEGAPGLDYSVEMVNRAHAYFSYTNSIFSTTFDYLKSRSDTPGVMVDLQPGDVIATLRGLGASGGVFKSAVQQLYRAYTGFNASFSPGEWVAQTVDAAGTLADRLSIAWDRILFGVNARFNRAVAVMPDAFNMPEAGSYTIKDGYSILILIQVGNRTAATLIMPANPIDGQVLTICSKGLITTLNHQANTGHVIFGALTTIPANGFARYTFRAGAPTPEWLRIG